MPERDARSVEHTLSVHAATLVYRQRRLIHTSTVAMHAVLVFTTEFGDVSARSPIIRTPAVSVSVSVIAPVYVKSLSVPQSLCQSL